MSHPRMLALTDGGPRLEVLDLPGDVAAPALVLLHEGLGSVGLWREFPGQLRRATGRRVVAFSRFGHGASDPPSRARTTAFHREEALDILPRLFGALQITTPVLVGHSDGASIALIHAARHPVSALVLLAPHVFVEPLTLRGIRQTREEYLHGDLRARMARRHADPDAAFWGWCQVWLDPEFADWNLEADVARVGVPALLVQGAGDPYGTLEQLDRIQAAIRGPVDREVLSGGHSPHREHGEWLAGRVAGWLAGAQAASAKDAGAATGSGTATGSRAATGQRAVNT